jgi:hypothetical protein
MQRKVICWLMGSLIALSSYSAASILPKKHPKQEAPATAPNAAFERVVDRVLAREAENVKALRSYSPLVETYLQEMRPDNDLGMVPFADQYYLNRAGFGKAVYDISFHPRAGFLARVMHGVSIKNKKKRMSSEAVAEGFSWMMFMDMRGLDRAHYSFDYQGREFLGDLRCIVIDITPKPKSGPARFIGRVWVEDRDYNIVRFNGTYEATTRGGVYLHFDTWRLNMKPGVWLPAYIYSEDRDPWGKVRGALFKSQTRIWGYNVGKGHAENVFTEVIVDDNSAVKDNSDVNQDLAPVAAQRAWQRQAEDNVVERLERGGLLARVGEVDKVLNTVVNNLEITNNLDIQPEVRCRVLLTTPAESFSMGHTIFISRGMLDVLPDEASLASILSHELAHIVLGHPTDTTFAFKDRSIVSDQEVLARLHFTRTLAQEKEADTRALALLQNSPYKDKLGSVGLFLRQVDARRDALPHLIRSQEMGNSLLAAAGDLRLKELTNTAPRLDAKSVSQIAALPLGGRIRVDPWNNHIEINKAKPVQLLTAREKMPLEVTPVFPHLTRLAVDAQSDEVKPAAADPTPAQATSDTTAAPPAASSQAQATDPSQSQAMETGR